MNFYKNLIYFFVKLKWLKVKFKKNISRVFLKGEVLILSN